MVLKLRNGLQLLATLLVVVSPATAYRDGARSESCYNMLTNHSNTFSGMPMMDPAEECGVPCPFSIEVVARVNDEDSREHVEEPVSAFNCGAVYEGRYLREFMCSIHS